MIREKVREKNVRNILLNVFKKYVNDNNINKVDIEVQSPDEGDLLGMVVHGNICFGVYSGDPSENYVQMKDVSYNDLTAIINHMMTYNEFESIVSDMVKEVVEPLATYELRGYADINFRKSVGDLWVGFDDSMPERTLEDILDTFDGIVEVMEAEVKHFSDNVCVVNLLPPNDLSYSAGHIVSEMGDDYNIPEGDLEIPDEIPVTYMGDPYTTLKQKQYAYTKDEVYYGVCVVLLEKELKKIYETGEQ